jgi:putative toxin-antitoxin system antitoxin component (TIGR02293 family)
MAQKQSNTFDSDDDIKKIKEINERYDLTFNNLAAVLDVTPKTLTRWTNSKKGTTVISEQKTDRLKILESILELGKEVLGSDDELNEWLHHPVFALDGKKPIELLKTESGRRRVEEVLHQIEYGIY